MSQLSFRQRFPLFLAIALPALSAFGMGRLLANAGAIFAAQFGAVPLPTLTRLALWLSAGLPIQAIGSVAAIAIASLGFLIVRKFAPDRMPQRLALLVTAAWLAQVAVLMLALMGFALPFARP
jgi:hypothetical protein